jgi:isopenicillin N synthase-like dioxygenase
LRDLPIVDLADRNAAPRAIDAACRDTGFFYIVGHGVDDALGERLEELAREFFALDDNEKAAIAMERAGPAWRGWFPVGGELTSGRPDRKEGIYFGAELGPEHPRVQAGLPLHGANLFPARPAGLRTAVLEYLDELTRVGHAVLAAMAVGLGLPPDWFDANVVDDPTVLFRIFHYPPSEPEEDTWGVGEHTDYGLLTILRQDETGGLEVKSPVGWIEAPPIPGSFVCNLGDMLERMTGGRYRSTPHRVRNTSGIGRLSFPFFFDPSWDAEILPTPGVVGDPHERWDGADVHAFEGTYGDYLLAKVAKVFPALKDEVLDR